MTTRAADPALPELDEELQLAIRVGMAWRELRRGAAMSALRDRLYGAGPQALDLGQVDTLEQLVYRDGCRMSELADALRIDASTATRAVNRLVDDGLAVRTADPDDARCVRVAPTGHGREVFAELSERRRAVMVELVAGFDLAERRTLAELMERLVDAVDTLVAD